MKKWFGGNKKKKKKKKEVKANKKGKKSPMKSETLAPSAAGEID
jgi:hypothetical protein